MSMGVPPVAVTTEYTVEFVRDGMVDTQSDLPLTSSWRLPDEVLSRPLDIDAPVLVIANHVGGGIQWHIAALGAEGAGFAPCGG